MSALSKSLQFGNFAICDDFVPLHNFHFSSKKMYKWFPPGLVREFLSEQTGFASNSPDSRKKIVFVYNFDRFLAPRAICCHTNVLKSRKRFDLWRPKKDLAITCCQDSFIWQKIYTKSFNLAYSMLPRSTEMISKTSFQFY